MFFVLFSESFGRLDDRLDAMEATVTSKLLKQGFTDEQIETQSFLHLRYHGTDCALMCAPANVCRKICLRHGNFHDSFLQR